MKRPTALWLLALIGCTSSKDASTGDDDDDDVTTSDTDLDTGTDTSTDTATNRTGPYGPPNAWWHADAADVPPGLGEDGSLGLGYRPPNLTYTDQNGDRVALYQFYGRPVQLSITASWSAPGQDLAVDLAAVSAQLDADGIQVIELLVENVDGRPPGPSDATTYADAFGSPHPVLAVDDTRLEAWVQEAQNNFPITPILDPELRVVVERNLPFDEALLRSHAP